MPYGLAFIASRSGAVRRMFSETGLGLDCEAHRREPRQVQLAQVGRFGKCLRLDIATHGSLGSGGFVAPAQCCKAAHASQEKKRRSRQRHWRGGWRLVANVKGQRAAVDIAVTAPVDEQFIRVK